MIFTPAVLKALFVGFVFGAAGMAILQAWPSHSFIEGVAVGAFCFVAAAVWLHHRLKRVGR